MSETETSNLKKRLPTIKTLSMLKMEKNFIAVIEKGYLRQPYLDPYQPLGYLVDRLLDEFIELKLYEANHNSEGMKEELADMSNIIDYIFEKLSHEEGAI